jgi:Galactose mutarotase and related enzymes
MYAALIRQRFAEWRRHLWQDAVVRSGAITMVVLALILLVLAFGWREHKKGRFALLKAELKRPAPSRVAPPPQPGGQDAIVLERTPIGASTMPEFLSATVLPGRGMNVLQIKAFVPSKGEIELLASPPLADAATIMSGTGADANGAASLTLGAPIEIPWAGRIYGTATDNGLITTWNGEGIHLPAERQNGVAVSTGGLLLRKSSTSVKTNVMPDGGAAEAVYDVGDFDDHWPSRMQISTSVQLSGRALEMKVVALNTGNEPQPIGIGWRPRFALLNKDRETLMLRVPSATRAEVRDRHTGVPSGRLLPVAGTEYDFTARTGGALGSLNLDDTFVQLRQAPLDNGPVAELRDPANNYGLRITMLSTTIKALHVTAPANADFIAIAPQFNYDDPFGREWPRNEDTGMVVLQPGRSVMWRIRLEIFALVSNLNSRL